MRHKLRIISKAAVPSLWALLAVMVAGLVALAVFLLISTGIVSGRRLDAEQYKSLWAFLGVALGVVATLVGALLTEQHNRRTRALTKEASERERLAREESQALARTTERRMTLDTIGRMLDLITVEDGFAPRARVAGAIATMVELEGSAVGVRILGELWSAGAVGDDTASWLINRIIMDETARRDRPDEVEAAAELLAKHANRLVPAPGETEQDYDAWPHDLTILWPPSLSEPAKDSLVLASVRTLHARGQGWWRARGFIPPLEMLLENRTDPQLGSLICQVLAEFHSVGALSALRYEQEPEIEKQIVESATRAIPTPWFAELLRQTRVWLQADDPKSNTGPLDRGHRGLRHKARSLRPLSRG